MTVRIGILGCGSIARSAHLPSLLRIPDATVVVVADHDAANLTAAQSLVRGARAVRDSADVLAMPDVDAVLVALPPALHADATIAALDRGKHVYVEKPLATTMADARRMVAAARATTLTAMVGFNYRFHPIVQNARARIAAGAVGTPIGIRSVFATSARPIAPWKQRRDSGGGVLLDLAVHHVDLVHFLLDASTTDVWAEVRSVRTEHDTAFVHSRLTNGTTASSMFSLSAVEEDRIEVYGTAGKVTIDRYGSLRAEVTSPAARGAFGAAVGRLVGELGQLPAALEKRRAPLHDPSFPAAMHAFVRAVRDRSPATPSFGDGLRAIAVIEAAEASAASGRVVSVDAQAAALPPRADRAGV
jgi:myo-inositol 2-dehydrogenase / D-chiro-inositol 1-dehydrogenase